ncbi:MAG: hypothetical protein NZL95_09000, partial [Chitinophagales bacterium]|nr:hypothetical protein [Chitinophagales bacterium]MDW8428671.1 hypothetical protein [Chitinophagales bacterium]
MKRVIVLSYYWPPCGGAGVQRWLKMCKYLPEFGWEPVVYTASNADYPILDFTLEAEVPPWLTVLRQPIREPYAWYKRLIGQPTDQPLFSGFLADEKRPTGVQQLSLWIRANLFIPDARCWWIRPSVRFLNRWLKQHAVDAIASTGPPHSVHLIALHLKKQTGLPWLADFRDPWTHIDYFKDLPLTPWALRRHRHWEHQVLT